MVRINLLPPEITEKRKFERFLGYVMLVGAVLIAVIVVVWGFLQWQVSRSNATLQQTLDSAAQVRNQAEAFKIFETRATELAQRKQVAQQALAGRIDWGRLTNEMSLVLPSDVWLLSLEANEESLVFTGDAIDAPNDVPDLGHKAVAKTLVRLSGLDLIENVWLTRSEKQDLEELNGQVINFEISSTVKKPAASTTTSSVPAPPSQSAQ